MIPDNIATLVTALINKTKIGKATWTKSSMENEFRLYLKNAAITIGFWTGDFRNNEHFDISFYNTDGDKIDSYSLSENDDRFELLKALYSAVKREYFNVDKTINDLLGEINSDDSIGNDDDDF